MKLANWKRALLAGLLTLSVAGGSLAPLVARPAAASGFKRPDGVFCCGPGRPVSYPD